MIKHLSYSIDIQDINGDLCEIYTDDDLQSVVAMFSSLALLDLPVSISYCSWYTDEKEKE